MPSNTVNLGYGSLTIQYMVVLFNLIFFASGLVLIIVGGIAQGFFKEYIQFFDNEFKTPAMGLIILGGVILIVSFFGCCGAKKQNVCMLNTFAFLLFVMLIGEIIATFTMSAFTSDVETVIANNMNKTMYVYEFQIFWMNTPATRAWIDLQSKFECCGISNYTNWGATPYGDNGKNVPDSCCQKRIIGCGKDVIENPVGIFTDGCLGTLRMLAQDNLGAIIWAVIAIGIIQIIGICISIIWMIEIMRLNTP